MAKIDKRAVELAKQVLELGVELKAKNTVIEKMQDDRDADERFHNKQVRQMQYKIDDAIEAQERTAAQFTKLKETDLGETMTKVVDLNKKIKDFDAVKATLGERDVEIKVLKTEIDFKDKLVEQLGALPDVKKMIDTVSSMRIPAVDEMKELYNSFRGSDFDKFSNNIQTLTSKVDEVLQRRNEQDGYGRPSRDRF